MTGYLQSDSPSLVKLSTYDQLLALAVADQTLSGQAGSAVPPSSPAASTLPALVNGQVTSKAPAQQLQSSDPKALPLNAPLATVTAQTNNNVGFDQSQTVFNTSEAQQLLIRSREFKISYTDVEGVAKVFVFSLLPAIDSNLRSNVMGAQVPEVKPGILIRTSMNIKRFLMPGSQPFFQPLGIEQTILQMVGLFVGTENTVNPNPNAALYGHWGGVELTNLSAYKQAQAFDQNVVQAARSVDILIRADGNSPDETVEISYRGLLQNFRLFVARSDRVYYALDAVVTTYPVMRKTPTNRQVASR